MNLTRLKRKEGDVDGLVNRQMSLHRKQRILGNLCGLKSNSLRRTAKEKEMTRKDIEDKIANVVDELKKTLTFTCLLARHNRYYEKLNIL